MPSQHDPYPALASLPTCGVFRACEGVLTTIMEAKGRQDLETAFAEFATQFGVKRMGQLVSCRSTSTHWQPIGLRHNMDDVDQEYFRRNIQRIDPVLSRNQAIEGPVAWGLREQRNQPDENVQKFYRFHDELENPHGLAVAHFTPQHVTLLALTAADSEGDFVKRIPELAAAIHLFGIYVADAIWRLNIAGIASPPHPGLTPRETECLSWVAAGKTAWEISCILNVSERTIVAHTENAKKKLGARTLPQAVALALSRGTITL